MLPKTKRLSSTEVREILSSGRGIKSGVLSLKYVANKGDFRASVVAPKSVVKAATKRNYLRRVLYSTLATLPAPHKKALQGYTGVFFIRSLPSPAAPVLREDVINLIKKLHPHV